MMDKEMYDAVCSECGNKCKVPFKPTEGRPVKCGDCFKKFSRPEKRFDNNNNRRDFNKRKDFDVTCAKCGKKTTVPFKPTQGKPVLCRDCFRK